MKRREFIVRIGGAALVAPIVANLVACGDDDGDDGGLADAAPVADAPAADAPAGCAQFDIGDPQDGHSKVNISDADVAAGVDKEYTLIGGGHTHTFTITAAQFTTLAGGGIITVTSSTDIAHEHEITIGMC